MEIIGKRWFSDDLVKEVIKDRVYFEKSGGGITISGGEATMQPKFAAAFLKSIKEQGIHTSLDTCGQCTQKNLDLILPFTDLVLYDIKEIDPGKHKEFTESSNKTILDNLMYVCGYMNENIFPREIWIRTPIIPQATDRKDNIIGIGRFIASHCGRAVSRWELCSFNNLCKDKYIRLGMDWRYKDSGLMSREEMHRLAEIAKHSGVNPDIVHWSGSVELEENGQNIEKNEEKRLRLVKGADVCSKQ